MKNIYNNLHSNQKIFIYEMLKRGISVEILDEKREIILASYKDHCEIFKDRDSSIMPYNVSVLAGDKGFTKKILMRNNISVPIGEVFSINNIEGIKEAFKVLDCPVVLKPTFGSHGFDVHTNIKSEKELLIAINEISKSRGLVNVLIEEYFKAKEYRLFITKHGDFAVLHRDPASIIGNGVNSIKELIDIENYKRMHPRVNSLCPIIIDDEVKKYLSEKNLSLNSIPSNNKKIYLRDNSNVAVGGISIDYTNQVHKSVIDTGLKVLSSFPGLPYAGIDFMTNNIDKKQTDYSYRIIEVNTVPGAHMHLRPAIGEPHNIAKYIIDMIFPETICKGDEYEKSDAKIKSLLRE